MTELANAVGQWTYIYTTVNLEPDRASIDTGFSTLSFSQLRWRRKHRFPPCSSSSSPSGASSASAPAVSSAHSNARRRRTRPRRDAACPQPPLRRSPSGASSSSSSSQWWRAAAAAAAFELSAPPTPTSHTEVVVSVTPTMLRGVIPAQSTNFPLFRFSKSTRLQRLCFTRCHSF